MTDAEQILKMIENVSPSDTAKLDEIDARVTAYVLKSNYIRHYTNKYDELEVETDEEITNCIYNCTRSRDALKAIRPEGWVFTMRIDRKPYCPFIFAEKGDLRTEPAMFSPSEELAELGAIIQAIEHERKEK
jgi:hypothetical protein